MAPRQLFMNAKKAKRGLENEVTCDFVFETLKGFILSSLSEIYFLFILSLISANSAAAHS